MVLVVVALLVAAASGALPPACNSCTGGDKGTLVCSQTQTTFVMLANTRCFWDCGITVLYPGPCGCPNSCFDALGRGICLNGTCSCLSAFTGPDCSLPTPSSPCRGRGTVVDGRCVCEPGFSGAECEPSPPSAYLPQLHGPAQPQRNPLFAQNHSAVIAVTLDPATLVALLEPRNAYNQTYMAAINVTVDGVPMTEPELKLGGQFTKRLAKKGWLFKGKKFDHKVHKLKTKTGATDASYINSVVGTDLFWAMGVPVPQVTWCQIWFNGVAQGFHLLYEAVDDAFFESRFGFSNANLYSGDGGTLTYLGDNVTAYQQMGYVQESGDGDWSDFLLLLKSLNASSFEYLDVDSFIRHLAVEALFSFGDGFTCRGSNYYLYNTGSKHKPYFVMIPHDFDDSFGTKSGHNVTEWAQIPLMSWGTNGTCWDQPSFLTRLVITNFEAKYVAALQLLLTQFQRIESRVSGLYDVFQPYIAQDRWYPLDVASGGLDTWFTWRVTHWQTYLQTRAGTAGVGLNASKIY